MAYVSLYRKYRSQSFGDLIGQDHVVRTLQNGISSQRISHAYLFTGPRGTGKTSSARLLAKALCCEKGPIAEPCNVCDICRSITDGSCIDVFEMDAASESGVEDVRETIVQVTEYMPAMCRYKVFIIDEVHDLSAKAFDALLKTIEEPPPHIIFVLATTEYNKLPPTIRSRCQKFEFHRASIHDLVSRLEHVAKAEDVNIDPGALYAIARMADGGFRDALTLLEQAIISSPSGQVTLQDVYDQLGLVTEEVTDEILSAVTAVDVPGLTKLLTQLTQVGRDPRAILESMLYRLADLTRIVYGVEDGGVKDAARHAASHELAVRMGQDRLLQIRSLLAEAHKVIRDISLPRLWLESELIRIALISQPGAVPAHVVTQTASSHQEVKPAARRPQEAASPKPEPVAVKEPLPENPPAHEVATTFAPSGDPELDNARLVWSNVLKSLPAEAPIGMKLADSSVASFRDQLLTIEMPKKIHHEWITDKAKPGRLTLIMKELDNHGGKGWKVEFRPGKNGVRNHDPKTVELPAEGEQLRRIIQEEFGS